MTVNDGKGLYDKYGLIDSIIQQLNSLEFKGINNASVVCDIYKRLAVLKKGLQEEEKSKAENEEVTNDG